ncbi:hypothetical protein [Streptomyces sp. SPB162]|uniref:hypothetical protein n=1 Tax=Streptomyces sp. SPB162 TaxID=2940560 RepID=UPI002405937E|nr:hypothetical protein [Streptomyces sp. SPB162]MDF9810816.1 non-homologous end joining protein Ku [Streptomyces sp. SPB162]
MELADNEIKAAIALIDALGEADLDTYEDQYTAAVADLVRGKVEGAEVAPAGAPAPAAGKVVDLMEALEASLAQAKENRGQDATVHDIAPAKAKASADKAPAKKTTAKKTTAKKAAKKAPAKKTAARKRSA